MAEKVRTQTVFGSMPYHKGYTGDKYQYPVLAIDRLPKAEKEMVRAKIKTLTTGREAQNIIGDGWTFEIVDQHGRIGLLKRNGIEVALFLQRQMVQEQLGPGDPVPEVALKDLIDQWQRLDIIGPSAKQANFFTKREVDNLREQVGLLNARASNLQELSDTFEVLSGRKQQEVEGLQEQVKKLKLKLAPQDKIIVKQEGFRYLTAEQAKKVRAAATKRARKP